MVGERVSTELASMAANLVAHFFIVFCLVEKT